MITARYVIKTNEYIPVNLCSKSKTCMDQVTSKLHISLTTIVVVFTHGVQDIYYAYHRL